jgi:hypothetical protein
MTRLSNGRLQCDRCLTASLPFASKNSKDWVEQVHAAGWRAVPIMKDDSVNAYRHHCRVYVEETAERARAMTAAAERLARSPNR